MARVSRSEDNLEESVPSFRHVVPGMELWLLN